MSHYGYVQREYREDGIPYHPDVNSNDVINNLDNVYYAQVDVDAPTKLGADPYVPHISNLYELEPSLGQIF